MKKPITGILIASACLTLACICCPTSLFTFPPAPATIPPTSTLFPTITPFPTETDIPAPSSTPLPCADASCQAACAGKLDEIIQASESDASPLKTFTGDTTNEGSIYNLVSYTVTGDMLSAPEFLSIPDNLTAFQQDTATQLDIWKLFTAIIPFEQRKAINEYIVFTDGSYELLASVELSDNAEYWSLRVDIVDARDQLALSATLLHEDGHLLTLGNTQLEDSPYICTADYVNPGCGKPGSYIDLFYQRFWSDMYDDWASIQAIKNPQSQAKRMEQFYIRHRHEFLTVYSATEPAEDIAEAWIYFILAAKPAGDTTIAEDKILFFYDFPELVQLRADIDARLCGYFLDPKNP